MIIDNGSSAYKVKFAGDQISSHILNSFVAIKIKTNDIYISNEAYLKADTLNINYAIKHHIIQNWEDIQE